MRGVHSWTKDKQPEPDWCQVVVRGSDLSRMEEKKDRAMSRKIILVVTASLIALTTTTARNTVRGLEQDLESVANDVDEAT